MHARGLPAAFHVLVALGVASLFLLERLDPPRYESLMQEDRAVEWWTVALFGVAAAIRLRHAIAARRPFDLLVGFFCLFVAGEEISWGQRLLGFVPPESFLEHNTQQELTIHNFADLFGRPKWSLIAALAGYGLLLPAAAAVRRGRRLLGRVGATPPPRSLAVWFLLAVALLIWYPLAFTGEWVELLAGALFVAAAAPRGTTLAAVGAATFAAALVLTRVSAAGSGSDAQRVACAAAESAAMLDDLVAGGAATPRARRMRSIHKRAWTAAGEGYVDWGALRGFRAVACEGPAAAGAARRREFGVDPWGTAYWIRLRRSSGGREITVYSFGPNRRRDDGARGDDVVARTVER